MIRFLVATYFVFILAFTGHVLLQRPPEIKMKADAIVVATGSKGRIQEGISLLSQGIAPILFISGVGHNATKAQLGIPSDIHPQIILGHSARNTRQNVSEVMQWQKEHGYKHIIIVTSDYHLPRLQYEINRRVEGTTTFYPVKSSYNLKLFKLIFLESHKLCYAWLKDHTNKIHQ